MIAQESEVRQVRARVQIVVNSTANSPRPNQSSIAPRNLSCRDVFTTKMRFETISSCSLIGRLVDPLIGDVGAPYILDFHSQAALDQSDKVFK